MTKPFWFDTCYIASKEGRAKLRTILDNINSSYVTPMIYPEGKFLPVEIRVANEDNVKIYGLYVDDV